MGSCALRNVALGVADATVVHNHRVEVDRTNSAPGCRCDRARCVLVVEEYLRLEPTRNESAILPVLRRRVGRDWGSCHPRQFCLGAGCLQRMDLIRKELGVKRLTQMLVVWIRKVVQTVVEGNDIPTSWVGPKPTFRTLGSPVCVVIVPGRVHHVEAIFERSLQRFKVPHRYRVADNEVLFLPCPWWGCWWERHALLVGARARARFVVRIVYANKSNY